MFEGCDCRVCDARPLQSSNCLLPCLICCLGRLLHVQLCRGFVLVIKSVEVGGEGCFNDCGQASFQGLLRQTISFDSILDRSLDARFGYECTHVRWSRAVSRSLVSNSRACAECHAVFREARSRSRDRCPTPPWISAARCS